MHRMSVRSLWSATGRGRSNFSTVGRLETEKNPLLLVEAFAALHQGTTRNLSVDLDRPRPTRGGSESARATPRGQGTDRFPRLCPFRRGPPRSLSARTHVRPRLALRRSAKVLIEALACSTPLIATDVGGIRAALGDEEVALLVPSNDRQALTTAMRRILDQADLRTTLVLRGSSSPAH